MNSHHSDERAKFAAIELEKLRLRLLDLTGRNRFLNFRHSETSRTQLRVVDDSLEDICELLERGTDFSIHPLMKPAGLAAEDESIVEADDQAFPTSNISRRKRYSASALAEIALAQGISPDFDLAQSRGAAEKLKGLRALLFEDELERRLQGIYAEERRFVQELGISTLYGCTGFLEWYEADHSDKARFAPLLLYPVQVRRALQAGRYRFKFSGIGEDPESNISLIERLGKDFAIRLPEFDADAGTAASYLADVASIVGHQKRWRVRPFVTFAILNFAKLAMYRDLDAEKRPANAELGRHTVIQELLSGADRSVPSPSSEDDVDGPELRAKVPLLVTEADSSQFAAIADALSGRSLVIEGPPGTGKSQTITNIIGAALSKGLRVLFVAEKLAALQVVKSKLDSYGLGPFCLELHSTKARKSDVHASIAERLRLSRPNEARVGVLTELLEQKKSLLGGYVRALNSVFGRLGQSVHQLLWREQRMRLDIGDQAASVEAISIPGAIEFSEAGLSEASQAVRGYGETYRDVAAAYGGVRKHPWFGINASEAPLRDRHEFLTWCNESAKTLDGFGEAVGKAANAIGFRQALSIADATAFSELTLALGSGLPDSFPLETIVALRDDGAAAVVERLLENIETRRAIEVRYGSVFLARLSDVAEVLAPAARKLAIAGYADESMFALGQDDGALQTRRRLLRSAMEYISLVESTLGDGGLETRSCLQKVAQILVTSDRRVVLARSAALLDEMNRADLLMLAARGKALASRESGLRLRVDLVALEGSPLRSWIKELKTANVLWFLSSGVRAARKAYKSAALTKGSISCRDAASNLTDVADLFEERDAFGTATRFGELAGKLYEGLATDFDLVTDIVEFGTRIREETRGLSPAATRLREIVLGAPLVEVDRISDLGTDSRMQVVEAAQREASALESRLSELDEAVRCASVLSSVAAGAGIPDATTIRFLGNMLEDADRWLDLGLKIDGDGAARRILGRLYAGAETQPGESRALLRYAQQIGEADIPRTLKDRIAAADAVNGREGLRTLGHYWAERRDDVAGAVEALSEHPFFHQKLFFGMEMLKSADLDLVRKRLFYALTKPEEIDEWVRFVRVRTKAVRLAGKQLVQEFEDRHGEWRTPLEIIFDYLVVRTLVRSAVDASPELRDFPGATLNEARREYQNLDRQLIEAYRQQLAAKLHATRVDPGNNRGPRGTWTGAALILNECGKQKRHISIRDLVTRAGSALQQLKPCFMMSPLSVAQYIAPGTIEFDLIVIDEASQMRPEDAIGAVSRGKCAIVVGDPKQLPPTSFFESSYEDDEVSDEDAFENESILDLAMSQYGKRRLRWHYRSRHESLIAFSNHQFYDDDLIVFPSPDRAGTKYGVRSHYVSGLYKSSVNVIEARAVAEAVITLMHEQNGLSIGVVAMNGQQRDIIQEELDKLIAADAGAASYVDRWEGTLYPFFVKNLESVQGDERDIIVISTVYGPERPGDIVAQRFGPILGPTGWRRLNVLFTRARNRVDLFTSMRPSDVKVGEGRGGRGVVALRDYLDYAQTGRLETGETTRRAPDSDFEIAVASMLEAKGFEVEAQVGVAHYFIDLAVRDPRNGSYLLGVECDGATYHRAKSARDRDRTREEALGQLGWKLYRIWSTDWFANPKREVAKLEAVIRSAMQ